MWEEGRCFLPVLPDLGPWVPFGAWGMILVVSLDHFVCFISSYGMRVLSVEGVHCEGVNWL